MDQWSEYCASAILQFSCQVFLVFLSFWVPGNQGNQERECILQLVKGAKSGIDLTKLDLVSPAGMVSCKTGYCVVSGTSNSLIWVTNSESGNRSYTLLPL